MHITHVRNATLLVEAAGLKILVDPMLGAKGSFGPAPTTVPCAERNPLVDLPMPLTELLDADLVVVTHTHPDHWDAAAAALLPRSTPIVVQNRQDADELAEHGFTAMQTMEEPIAFGPVTITRTEGRHGADDFLAANPGMGLVSGFVLSIEGEPSLYVAGDTVWTQGVIDALDGHRPDVVVLNTGEARWAEGDPIIMGAQDVIRVHEQLPSSQIVAVHMEALNHCTVSRADVRALAEAHRIGNRVHVPADGERLTF
ncbi:MBL fold metallo-hydrolase [Zhihengliuella alba]|uniref:MBL fold metallo-hydrolase n=1 Tax=Zhihengliuella alba TaxID=547018 RepID=A0ABP7CQW8_9MICC